MRIKMTDAELIAETGIAIAVDVSRAAFEPIGGIMFPLVCQVRTGSMSRGADRE
jgi:hypothetical protein